MTFSSSFSSETPEPSSKDVFGRTRINFGNDLPTSRPSHASNKSAGVASVQFGVSEDAFSDDRAQVAPTGNARRPGVVRMNMHDGVVHQAGVQRASTATPSDGTVLGSARSAFGSVISPANLKHDDLVDVGGMKTTVAVAEQMGLLRKEAGGWVEVAAPPQSPAQAAEGSPEAAPEGPPVESFSRAVEDGISALVEVTDASTQLAIVDAIAREGVVSEALVGRLASQAGMEPADASRFIEGVRGEFEAQAAKSLSKLGVNDMSHFGEWAAQNGHETELARAITEHVTSRSTASYAKLATQYVESIDRHSPELLFGADLGPGVEVIKGNDGLPVLQIGGRTYGWASAIRAGLVTVSGR
ncbi:hypothetical protein [uncultured Alsobacter sp.]|uniref:hypothetical protein n=1 Tax=uncultured Alsobacter sp. TaxID=1748258 RepID=UPI0025E9FAC7|nr:hypothetical protein [uncultured Alsobacter sp.]